MFKDCPAKYEARYITRRLVVDFSGPAAMRGLDAHALLEYTLKHGYPSYPITYEVSKGNMRTTSWDDHPDILENTRTMVGNINQMMAQGWRVYIEMEAATDGNGKVCGWWDKRCFMRAKIDVFMVSPDGSAAIILDWKTGRAENINPYQLDFIGLVLVPEFGLREYAAIDYLIDTGEPRQYQVVVDRALPKFLSAQDRAGSRMVATLEAISDIQIAHNENKFIATPSAKVCRYCEWKEGFECPSRYKRT